MISLILVNLIVGISSYLMLKYLFDSDSLADLVLTGFLLYLSQIVISLELLGMMKILFLKNIIILELAILVFIYWLIKAKKLRAKFNFRDKLAQLLSRSKLSKLEIALLAAILGFGIAKIYVNLISPPFGWDNLNYHFTFPVEWLKNGNLINPITIFDNPSPPYYPINGSLLFFWFIIPLKNVFIADLSQIPFFIIGFLAVYSLGVKIGIKKEYAFMAACLFTIIPNYFKQIEIAYVDVMVGSLFLVSLNYLFLLEKEFSLKYVTLFGMALGLLIGIKTLALPYSILLILPFVYLIAKNINKAYFSLILFICIIVLGGFSYIRNMVLTGNPLYPMQLKIFGRILLKGVVDAGTYRVHFKPEDYSLSKMLFHEGLGGQALIFILPSVFLALPVTIIKKIKLKSLMGYYFLLLPILIYLFYRYTIPLANTRYLYNLFAVGLVCGFYLFKSLNLNPKILRALVIICFLASLPELSSHAELIFSILFSLIILFLLPRIYKIKHLVRKRQIFIGIVGLIIVLIGLEEKYVRNEYPGYIKMEKYSGFWPDATRAWVWLNNNTSSDNIAYVGRPVPFPLYGTRFKNNVFYVSVNKIEPAKLHYFKDSFYKWGYDFLSLHKSLKGKGNYRSEADYNVWLANIKKRKTDYLFIYSLHQTKDVIFPLEKKWAEENQDVFNLVFQNDTIRIYRIIK